MFTDYNGKRIVESVAVIKSGSYSIPVLLSSAAEQPAPTSHSHLFGLNAAYLYQVLSIFISRI